MSDAPKVDAFHARGTDGVIRGLNEHYDSVKDVEQDLYGAWLAIQNLWNEREDAHKRGLEDAAKIAEGWHTLGAPQGIAAAIRAKIQERDDDN